MKKTLAFIMAILTTFTALSFGACNGAGTSDSSTGKEQVEQSSGFEVNAGQESGISFLATTIAESDYEAYGVSAQAESALTITATVTPENATNIALDWSVAFADPASEWATGKTVTDFVIVTPTEDGALTAVVENFSAFGEQIIITVTSRENSAISASCTADYAERIMSLKGVRLAEFVYASLTSTNADDRCFWEIFEANNGVVNTNSYNFNVSFNSSVCTISDTFIYNVKVKLTDEFERAYKAALSAVGLEPDICTDSLQDPVDCTMWGAWLLNYANGSSNFIKEHSKQYLEALQTLGARAQMGVVIVTATGEYSTYTEEIPILIHEGSLAVAVENVSLSDTNLTF